MGSLHKATVLVVDDDAEVRIATAAMLVAEGYRSVEARRASEAIDLLLKHKVDVLLTDIRMPGLSGFVLAREAKRFQRHCHINEFYLFLLPIRRTSG